MNHWRFQPKYQLTGRFIHSWNPGGGKKQQAKTSFSTSEGMKDLLLKPKSEYKAVCGREGGYRTGALESKDFWQTNEQLGSWTSLKRCSLLKRDRLKMNTPRVEDKNCVVFERKPRSTCSYCQSAQTICSLEYKGSFDSHWWCWNYSYPVYKELCLEIRI